MVFDDDAKLLGLFASLCGEKEELKKQIVHYIKQEGLGQPNAQQQAAADQIEDMSSPADSAIDIKKRKRMQALAEAKASKEQEAKEDKQGAFNLEECDVGQSPKLEPFKRKTCASPILQAMNKFKPKSKK